MDHGKLLGSSEIVKIFELRQEGKSVAEMARTIGRTRKAVTTTWPTTSDNTPAQT